MATTRIKPLNEDAAAGYDSGYRHDLDGLRGIAIALVAIFHVWFGRVSGGVDVFLTLSGYFFVASLLKHVLNTAPASVGWRQAIDPWPRLWRLLRRLIPPLFLVLAAVTAGIALIMPSTRWGPLAGEVIASALYYQNWYLAFSAQDYGAADSANSPLQHLWSMSMQGQFFVLTLLCGLALGGLLKLAALRFDWARSPRVVRATVGLSLLAVTLLSFAWANYRHGINQPFTYYDTVARLWEPLVGGLLAVWMPRLALHRRLRDLLGLVGVGLIISCGWWLDGGAEYPAAWALVPVGATLLIIWVGSGATSPVADPTPGSMSRALAHPRLVWLGSIAYALYLWHWPLLIFYLSWRWQDSVDFLEGLLILAASVLLAWATTRYFETPLRRSDRGGFSRRYTRGVALLLAAATLAAGTTVSVWQYRAATAVLDTRNLDPRLYPGGMAFLADAPVPKMPLQPTPELAEQDWPFSHLEAFSNFGDLSIKVETYGDTTADRTIAVVGGSHSEQWMDAIDDIGRRNGFAVTTYLKAGCALVTETVFTWFDKPYPECNEWSRAVMDRLAVDQPDIVFTTSTRPAEGSGDFVPPDNWDIFAEFTARGQQVIAVRDTPWTGGQLSPPECLAAGRKPEQCGVERDRALSPVDPAIALAETFHNVTLLDYSDAVCDDSYCPAAIGNILVWHDSHHLSSTFVRSIIPAIEADLQRATGWW